MKDEQAKARVDCKTRLQEKINRFCSKLQAQLLRKTKNRRQALAQVKVQILKAKAAAAKANW